MSNFRRLAVFAASTLGLAAAATPALAGGGGGGPGSVTASRSRVTISKRPPAFHGRVKSPSGGELCTDHRRVKLYRQRPGKNKLLGRDKTNRHARWEIDVTPLRPGAYYAKVKRTETVTVGGTFVCRQDRSRTVVVD